MGAIKLICTDIDGTLVLDDHRSIPEANRKALLEAQAGGTRLALVSGRGVFSQSMFAETLKLKEYGGFYIAFTGGKIVSAKDCSQIFGCPIGKEDVQALCDFVLPYGLDVMVYDDDKGRMYATSDNQDTRFDQQVTGMDFSIFRGLEQLPHFTIYKCIIAGRPRLIDRHIEKIKMHFSKYSITRSSDYLVEFNAKGATKGRAVETLCKHLGIGLQDVLAAGNGENDESMLTAAGMSAAPSDAMPGAKSSAKYVCRRTNAEGALAEAIEYYIGKGEK